MKADAVSSESSASRYGSCSSDPWGVLTRTRWCPAVLRADVAISSEAREREISWEETVLPARLDCSGTLCDRLHRHVKVRQEGAPSPRARLSRPGEAHRSTPQNESPHLALVAGAFAGAVEGAATYPFECACP